MKFNPDSVPKILGFCAGLISTATPTVSGDDIAYVPPMIASDNQWDLQWAQIDRRGYGHINALYSGLTKENCDEVRIWYLDNNLISERLLQCVYRTYPKMA